MSEPGAIAGPQRVAAFLLSLEPEVATSVLKTMSEDLVGKVAEAMVDLDPRLAKGSSVAELYRSIALALNGPKELKPCDAGALEAILARAFGPQKSRQVVQEILERRLKTRPFLQVEGHPPQRIALVLADESPAVCTLVLAHVAPATAAAVLGAFDKEKALAVVRGMATLSPPAAKVLRSIAENLEQRLRLLAANGAADEGPDRLKGVAEILNRAGPEIEKGAIQSIAEENSEIANELRERMFTWEDLATVDKRIMQKILGTVDTKTLSVAIKACSPAVEQNLLNNLSSRVRDMVAEERELAGAMPMSTVLDARNEMLRSIRAMIETGEFRPSRSGDDLVR